MDYKETLLMPKTEFQMKGNLPENEKVQRAKWEEMDLYNKLREKNKGREPFVLHDGPPYANGSIHIGHAMNKILKDFVNRYAAMSGRDMIYIPGWDTHGLPIEQAVTNSGVDRKSMDKAEFRAICEEYAKKQIAMQMEGFKALNVIADWDNYYATFQHELEARQIEVFAEMARKGLIFKGMKPVYWSPSSESALAEAEIEYHDRKDPSIFVAFEVEEGNSVVDKGDYLVIWTTTPWTLPGNTAICVGPNLEYSRVLVNGKKYVVAADLLDSLKDEFGWENVDVVNNFYGTDLEYVKYKHPFMDRISPVVLGDHVTLDAGSGLVHTAPSYGEDDFNVGKKYNLEMVFGVDDNGCLNAESGERFKGLFFEDANKEVVKYLDELGVLLKLKFITHSYPHDWRTKKPIIFRATAQWFCSIDKIKDDILNEIDNNINWLPEWGKVRLHNMIEGRGDWCISRQRVWGVPLPIFYNEDGSAILDYDVMMHVAELFREHGSNYWFMKDAKDLLPEGYTNPASPNGKFTKEMDIMDVWFDSGVTWRAVVEKRSDELGTTPVEMYLEGSDQHRGWFQSSLLTSVAVEGKAPYKSVLTHGFVFGEDGRKMSKSLGNYIRPDEIIKTYGADILRLWAASVDYRNDTKIGNNIIKQLAEIFKKTRNTARFLLGNIFDFNPQKDYVKYEELKPIDKFALHKLNKVVEEVTVAFDNYEFYKYFQQLQNFAAVDLSSFYLDIVKDRLYTAGKKSLSRRACQTVLYEILQTLVRMLVPVMPHQAEDIWMSVPECQKNSLESILLSDWVKSKPEWNNEQLEADFSQILKVREVVTRAIEPLRADKKVGSSLEVAVYIKSDNNSVLKANEDELCNIFITSQAKLADEKPENVLNEHTEEGYTIWVTKAEGEKCSRCWKYRKLDDNGICDECEEAVK